MDPAFVPSEIAVRHIVHHKFTIEIGPSVQSCPFYVVSRIEHWLLQSSEFKIQYPVSSIQYPVSSVQCPVSNITIQNSKAQTAKSPPPSTTSSKKVAWGYGTEYERAPLIN
ncbi:hypothetical protein BofuT4_P127050.1 [Botrytis cinerea T4]|uniref:Uncharacterized protein n=1 Tax=Botryotinia fuckeliana (strain T4) TaxID=999810 RepID=G2YSQ9_BOTF4|nr:hypothetical protein BofuT4_P127050.1 [Botrytis cinerea T4]